MYINQYPGFESGIVKSRDVNIVCVGESRVNTVCQSLFVRGAGGGGGIG